MPPEPVLSCGPADLAGEGVAAVTISIDNVPFQGCAATSRVVAQVGGAVLANPANAGREVDEDEARRLYDTHHVPAAGAPLFQAAFANFNPFGGETVVDSKNPQRGPLLIIGGENDHTVPTAVTNASYKINGRTTPAPPRRS